MADQHKTTGPEDDDDMPRREDLDELDRWVWDAPSEDAEDAEDAD